jgi:hypothetical protein
MILTIFLILLGLLIFLAVIGKSLGCVFSFGKACQKQAKENFEQGLKETPRQDSACGKDRCSTKIE